MGKTSSIPVDKTRERKMELPDEIAEDSIDSEMTVSNDSVGIAYCGSQAEDDDLEADLAMLLPAIGRKQARSDGHGYTDGHEIDSASHAGRVVVSPESLPVAQPGDYVDIPLPMWLKDIDSGAGMWTDVKQFRKDGKQYDKVSVPMFFCALSTNNFCCVLIPNHLIAYGMFTS